MLDEKLLLELRKFVEGHLNTISYALYEKARCVKKSLSKDIGHNELEEYINNNRKPTFNQVLFNFIDRKGTTDSEIYKKAGIDRRHFSKIRSNPDYRIGKNTAVALALALELNKMETDELLGAAGYSLSDSDTFDLVIQFCMEKKIYDILNVNEALDYFSLKPLSGVLE
ncbi:MAG: hypothetical protein Q8942_03385 [Bacillota bacterium]|nr:hypothetical protein [Bacillota bacterium]